jgi:hypothetical protein
MKYARADQPPAAGLQSVGLGEIQNAVISFIPIFDAFPHLGFSCAGLQAEEGVGEIVADVIVLRGK